MIAIPLAVFVPNHSPSNLYSALEWRRSWKLWQLLWPWRSPNCFDVSNSFELRVCLCSCVGSAAASAKREMKIKMNAFSIENYTNPRSKPKYIDELIYSMFHPSHIVNCPVSTWSCNCNERSFSRVIKETGIAGSAHETILTLEYRFRS